MFFSKPCIKAYETRSKGYEGRGRHDHGSKLTRAIMFCPK